MLRRMATAALAVLAAAALATPAALAQEGSDYTTQQVQYGDDVYGGTEGAAATGSAGQSAGAWAKYTARLTGAAEVGGGDPDGSGTASVRTRGTEVCYDLRWSGVDVTMAHIHKGGAGKNGDVVVNFFAGESPLDATSKSGCVQASAEVVKAIAARPDWYYVNLHSPDLPKGAVRGQLAGVDAAGASQLPYTGGPLSRSLLLAGLLVIAVGSTLLAVGPRRRVATYRPRH
jgi:hypothetical protein